MVLQACSDVSRLRAEPQANCDVADGDRFSGGTVWLATRVDDGQERSAPSVFRRPWAASGRRDELAKKL